VKNLTYLNTRSLEVLVGILLGDAYLKLCSNNNNVRIAFKQSIINFPFMWVEIVFTELAHFCSSIPRILFDIKFAYLKSTGIWKTYGQLILEI
jgi:hypothetical protein